MKLKSSFDAIIVGAGHNGLITGAYLARAGMNVLIIEKNDWVGGAAVSRSLYQGWTYSNCSYVCSLLRREIVRDLELPKYGLQVIPYEGGASFTRNGNYFAYYSDHYALRREISRFSARDADAYERYSTAVMRQCRFIRPFLLRNAPDPTSFRPRDLNEMAFLIKRAYDLGKKELQETMRFWTMSIGDFLDEHFESDLLKAHMAGSGIIGTGLGVYSPGTAYVLLHHYMGDIDGGIGSWGFARGGMGAISEAIAACFENNGGQIHKGSSIKEFIVKNGKVKGVALGNGDEFYAPIVVSNMDVKRTFLDHVSADALPENFIKAVQRFKIRGSSAKLNISLKGFPEFPSAPENSSFLRGDMHCTESLFELEKAYDQWKAGRWSDQPYIDMLIPSQIDPTMAPIGDHMMTVFVQYAPYDLKVDDNRSASNWTSDRRQALSQSVLDQISIACPNIRSHIEHMEIRSPLEIEQEVGLTEGNIFQGELTFDQLFFNRPIPGFSDYRSPIKGLYMCGSSTHPGGGVMGAPGANAARTILRTLSKDMHMQGYAA